jgi:hypothetical protein
VVTPIGRYMGTLRGLRLRRGQLIHLAGVVRNALQPNPAILALEKKSRPPAARK